MAGPDGTTPDPLIAELTEKPFEHDFFVAVRRIQSSRRNLPRIGHSMSPAQDPLRFAQSPALDFAPATIEAVRQPDPEKPPVLFARHFGLFGPNGPLPLCLTEYARDRVQHHGDRTFAAFCNVFHHRLSSFFFRAWADSRKAVDMDRPDDSHWVHYVGALIGTGMESFWRRDSVPDWARLYYAGRLVHQSRNAEGLEAILSDFFGIRTEIRSFVGQWIDLPEHNKCRIGASRETGLLGVNAVAGSRVWDTQLGFRIRMGPMKLADFRRMLPNGAAFRRLCDWVRFYCGEQFTWDVQLVLARDEVPTAQLGRGVPLGWLSWITTRPAEHDSEDLILQPHGGAN